MTSANSNSHDAGKIAVDSFFPARHNYKTVIGLDIVMGDFTSFLHVLYLSMTPFSSVSAMIAAFSMRHERVLRKGKWLFTV
jgi:hypothetical protein